MEEFYFILSLNKQSEFVPVFWLEIIFQKRRKRRTFLLLKMALLLERFSKGSYLANLLRTMLKCNKKTFSKQILILFHFCFCHSRASRRDLNMKTFPRQFAMPNKILRHPEILLCVCSRLFRA